MYCKKCFAVVKYYASCCFEKKGKHGVVVLSLCYCNGSNDGSSKNISSAKMSQEPLLFHRIIAGEIPNELRLFNGCLLLPRESSFGIFERHTSTQLIHGLEEDDGQQTSWARYWCQVQGGKHMCANISQWSPPAIPCGWQNSSRGRQPIDYCGLKASSGFGHFS